MKFQRQHGACAGENTKRRTPEYRAWRHMNVRCYNARSKDYPLYGGRGITVCARWRASFTNFLEDMGLRPSSKHSLDRQDSYGYYEPANCRWATATEQVRGRRKALRVTVAGETLPLIEWAKRLGLDYQTLYARTRRMTPEQAIRLPFNQHHGRKPGTKIRKRGEMAHTG